MPQKFLGKRHNPLSWKQSVSSVLEICRTVDEGVVSNTTTLLYFEVEGTGVNLTFTLRILQKRFIKLLYLLYGVIKRYHYLSLLEIKTA